MSTLAEDLINAVKNLQPRLCHRHAEKMIPPSEFKQIQSFWDSANNDERITVLRNFDSYNALELRRLFQLIARAWNFDTDIDARNSNSFKRSLFWRDQTYFNRSFAKQS